MPATITLNDEQLEREARERVERSPRLRLRANKIMADCPEGREHWDWVIRAPVHEILDWLDSFTPQRKPGRPPAAGDKRQVRISATVPPEYADWLRAHGDISAQLRGMIEHSMKESPA